MSDITDKVKGGNGNRDVENNRSRVVAKSRREHEEAKAYNQIHDFRDNFNKSLISQLPEDRILSKGVSATFSDSSYANMRIEVTPDLNISIQRMNKSVLVVNKGDGVLDVLTRGKMSSENIHDIFLEVNKKITKGKLRFKVASSNQKTPVASKKHLTISDSGIEAFDEKGQVVGGPWKSEI